MNAQKSKYKILVYGAGVIGSVYAVLLAKAGHDIYMYARGARLQQLKEKGLLYKGKKGICSVPVQLLEEIKPQDTFDYLFVTVRYGQAEDALAQLRTNQSPNIVTMVNNPNGYTSWEDLLGKGRLMPAFAGAGGEIKEGILYYRLTPRLVQPTTIGEISGKATRQLKQLYAVLQQAHIPASISSNMEAWQKCHLAMVVPLANGIYYDGGDIRSTAKNKRVIHSISLALRTNFNRLHAIKVPITPAKLNLFRLCPLWMMDFVLKSIYSTRFGETLIGRHASNAKEEMQRLDADLKQLLQ